MNGQTTEKIKLINRTLHGSLSQIVWCNRVTNWVFMRSEYVMFITKRKGNEMHVLKIGLLKRMLVENTSRSR
jgi:hypothetical protein